MAIRCATTSSDAAETYTPQTPEQERSAAQGTAGGRPQPKAVYNRQQQSPADTGQGEGGEIQLGISRGSTGETPSQAEERTVNEATKSAAERTGQNPVREGPQPTNPLTESKGVLGCLSTVPAAQRGDVQRATDPDGCSECDTIDCLADLLFGNLLGQSAQDILCQFQNTFSKSVNNQIASTGNALSGAVREASSAQAGIQGLRDIQRYIESIPAGALAQCLGSDRLKDWINGKIKVAENKLKNYERNKNSAVSNAFNSAIEFGQQLGNAAACEE